MLGEEYSTAPTVAPGRNTRSDERSNGEKTMPNGIDPPVIAISLLILTALIWCYVQIQALNRRLTSLEKQHLALILELEENLYEAPRRS